MLFYAALTFVATLASLQESVFGRESEVWSMYYSCRLDRYEVTNNYNTSSDVWFDAKHNKFRIDQHSDSSQFYVEGNSTNPFHSRYINVKPATEGSNDRTCTIRRSKYMDYSIFPSCLASFKFVGKEVVNGEETDHVQKIEPVNGDIVEQRDVWFAFSPTLLNYPIKSEYRVYDSTGTLLTHLYQYVSNYDIHPIDPKYWDITNGLNCEEVDKEKESPVNSELSDKVVAFLHP